MEQSPVGKIVSTEAEDIVGIRHQAKTGKDKVDCEDIMSPVVNCRVWISESAPLTLLTFCMCSINPITNPNPVYSHSYT
jgi:hypothetical protein